MLRPDFRSKHISHSSCAARLRNAKGEMQAISKICNTSLQVAIIGAEVRHGMLILRPENVVVLGGKVASLIFISVWHFLTFIPPVICCTSAYWSFVHPELTVAAYWSSSITAQARAINSWTSLLLTMSLLQGLKISIWKIIGSIHVQSQRKRMLAGRCYGARKAENATKVGRALLGGSARSSPRDDCCCQN